MINGILSPTTIRSSAVFSFAPKLPDGWNFLKSNFPNFFLYITVIAKASPIAICAVVLAVGTIPNPASLTLGIKILISDALCSNDFFLATIPIKKILFRLAYCMIFFSSRLSPELLINIKISFFDILPKSP